MLLLSEKPKVWRQNILQGTILIGEGFLGGSDGKASAHNAGDPGLISRLGRSPGEGNGNPLQYSCLENPTDGGAWWAIVHGVAKSQDMTEATQHIRMQYSYYLIYINGLRNIAVSYKKAHLTNFTYVFLQVICYSALGYLYSTWRVQFGFCQEDSTERFAVSSLLSFPPSLCRSAAISRSSSNNKNDNGDVGNKNNPSCHLTEHLMFNTSFVTHKSSWLDFLAITLPFQSNGFNLECILESPGELFNKLIQAQPHCTDSDLMGLERGSGTGRRPFGVFCWNQGFEDPESLVLPAQEANPGQKRVMVTGFECCLFCACQLSVSYLSSFMHWFLI